MLPNKHNLSTNNGLHLDLLKERAIAAIIAKYPNISSKQLILVDVDTDIKNNKLEDSYFEISYVDNKSLHSDDISQYFYDRYIIEYSLLSGHINKVVKDGWVSYRENDRLQ